MGRYSAESVWDPHRVPQLHPDIFRHPNTLATRFGLERIDSCKKLHWLRELQVRMGHI